MSPMYHEPSERPRQEPSRAEPSETVRERVLGACRREMTIRAALERRRWMGRWSLAAGVALMLAVNNVEEQRMAARIETLVQGPHVVTTASRPTPAVIAAWRARSVLLTALLLDPHAL